MPRKKLTILFDANPLASTQKSGVGYYTYRLVEALARNYPEEVRLVGHYFNFLGKRKGFELPKGPNINYRQSIVWPGKVLNILRRLGLQLPLEFLFKQSGDIALFPNFVSLPSLHHIPTAIVIHDMCFEDVPEYVSEKNQQFLHRFVPPSATNCDLILAVSESTENAVVRHYGILRKKFVRTPIAPPPPRKGQDRTSLEKLGIKQGYILFVGTLEPRKNIEGLIEAYSLLDGSIRDSYQLVLAGGKGWKDEAIQAALKKSPDLGKNIIVTGYIDDTTKACLYEHAQLFVLPSHYEGFGMPILEAMSYGIPPAISDISVFHEVAGGAAFYFDPNQPADIARVLTMALTNKDQRKTIMAAGENQITKFSWDKVAKEVLESFYSVVRKT